MTRRTLLAGMAVAPAITYAEIPHIAKSMGKSARDIFWKSHYLYPVIDSAIHEFHPDGGDFRRGPRIAKSHLTLAASILKSLGFAPYTLGNNWNNDYIPGTKIVSQEFPLYGVSGGLTSLTIRIWTRETAGKYECVCLEFCAFENQPGT